MFQTLTKNFREWFSVPTHSAEKENHLSPELLQRIKNIQVKTNYMVNDIMAGEYVSHLKAEEWNSAKFVNINPEMTSD